MESLETSPKRNKQSQEDRKVCSGLISSCFSRDPHRKAGNEESEKEDITVTHLYFILYVYKNKYSGVSLIWIMDAHC